jgi:hypothetical protein
MYLSDAPAGAVAEAFGTLAHWTSTMFVRPDLPGSVRALATYEIQEKAAVFDLDDAEALRTLRLRPSQVVTRDRTVTQSWALEIHEQGIWAGLRWWSYYDPRWYSYAIWEIDILTVRRGGVRPLHLEDPAVVDAAEVLGRPRE